MNHQIPMNKAVRRKGVTIAAAALSVALVAPFAQSVAYPEISAAAQAQENVRQELTLKRNPPVFYAEDARRGTEGAARSGSGRHVRSTGVLADTYFPAGTKFELADPSWTFNKGGWFGWNKNDDGSIRSAGPGYPSEMQNPTTGSASPYVVEDTGQVLFGLGAAANFGDRMMIPMRARYSAQDPETGQTREYVWRFEQGIQVGDKNAPADASNATCAPGEHWVNPPANLNQNILGHTMTKATQIEVQGQGAEATPVTLDGPILSGQSSISGNADGTGALQSRRATITVNVPGLEPLTTRAGIAGKWSISLPSGETFKDGQEISVTRTTHDGKESLAVKATVGDGESRDRVAPPTINPVVAGAETISGVRTAYAPVFVKFPGKDPIWAAPKEDHEYRNGEWSINVPDDVSLKAGDKIEVTAGYGGITLGTRNRNSNNAANLGTGASNYGFLNEVSGLTGGCYKDGETPKENPSQVDLKLTPEGDIEGQVGQPIDPVGVDVTNQPEGTKVQVDGLPDGLTYNPETKQIEGTPTAKTPEGGTEATITLVDEQGNAVKNAAGQDVSSKIRVTISPEDEAPTAPSISGDATADGNVIPEGDPTKIGQKVDNPTEGMGGTVTIDGNPVGDATVAVDPETGEITVTVPEGTLGDGVTEKPAKVQITDKDGQPVGDPIDAKVTKDISEVVDPNWNDTNLPDDGSRVNVPNTGDEIPHDTDVDLLVGYGEHNKGEQDWTVRLEEDGSITVIPGGDAAPEDSIEVHVELTYADGSTETKTFIVKVPLTFEGFFPENLGEPDYPNSEGSDRPNTPNTTHGEFGPLTGEDSGDITAGDVFDQADRFDPEWNDTDTPEDGSAVTVNNTGDDLPHGATVELGWGHGLHNKGTQDWDVELEENGDITVTPGADAEHGDSVLVQAVITYADGSTETKEFIVQVPVSGEEYVPGNFGEYGPMLQSEETELTAEEAFGQAEMIEPNWADTNTPEDGSPVTVKNTGDALPHGTKVDLGWGHGTHNKGTQDWDVDLEENGDITVKPGADAKPGDSIVVEVSITYPDGTKETKSFITQVPVTGEEFVPGNFGALPPLTGDDNDDLTAGDVFTEAPTVNPVNPGDKVITGTGKPGATITVTGPNGSSTTTKVNENGNWSIDVPGGATPESQYIVSQKDGDKAESDQVIVTVGKGGGEPVNPGLSSGSSNFDIPRHLQCAVFAGGVTAIPLILLSPLHNMYELVMNPHLAGLREQFNREIHAIDQQVRRSLGVEGHPALQVLDHINGRVHQFNQQLGQFAHENRHIGLAAAAIAVAGLSYQHCMNTQANQSSSATGSSVDLSSSSSEQQTESRGIVGWFQGLFNRK